MKTMLYTLSLAIIAFGGFAISSSAAYACHGCGCSEMKSSCNCAEKRQSNEKKCGCMKKASSTNKDATYRGKDKKAEKKPCKVCEKSVKAWNKKKSKSMIDHSEKGSVTFMSRGSVDTGYNN